jgi:hypothetical protein
MPYDRRLMDGASEGGATAAAERPRIGLDPAETVDPADRPVGETGSDGRGPERSRWWPVAISAALYLGLSLVVWEKVWFHHPSATTTCGCGDASLFTWFLEWPAYALVHGLSPFYSTAMFHPQGVNLLANTSQVALGTVLAPVSWISGPVMTLNVALTLSPVLSGLAMFVLLRRWVAWSPAAFVGGLLYGFSPFFLSNLSDAHLMVTMGPVPPLFVLLLDELLVRQRMRPVMGGIALGLLLTLQFFLGTETLVIMVFTGALGVALVVAYAAFSNRSSLRSRARHAAVGLGTGAVTALVLLAYPTWFALAGPAHFSGPIWPAYWVRIQGSVLRYFFTPTPQHTGLFGSSYNHVVGGYQGPLLSAQYFGIGMVVILVGGLIVWRRDVRLWLFGAITLVTGALSLGVSGSFTPWDFVSWLPLFGDILPNRFLVMTYLGAAVMLGLIVDHAHSSVLGRGRVLSDGRKTLGVLVGLAVAAVALVPIAANVAPDLPMTAEQVSLPTWFRTVAPHLPANQVVLVFPGPFGTIESAMTWQAVNRMHYSIVGGGGPGDVLARAGKERSGQGTVASATYSFNGSPSVGPAAGAAVHDALVGWGVDTVVVPDEPGLAPYDQPQSVTRATALMTVATGRLPVRQAGAWVWTGVQHRSPVGYPTSEEFAACTKGQPTRGTAAVDRATSCVLAAARH